MILGASQSTCQNCRPKKNKKEIVDSRIQSTYILGEAIRQCTIPPKVWINAASATIYQNSLTAPNDECNGIISDLKKDNMPYSFLDQLRFRLKKAKAGILYGRSSAQVGELDKDFSIKVCKQWENSFFEQRTPFTRKIALRTAITLGQGGVLIPYFNLLKVGLGGYQGNGKQMVSWIHEEDVARSIEWIYNNPEMEGIYNCAAPTPVTNNELMQLLRKITGNKFGLNAYSWMLELGAAIIGTETELILKSRWVVPAKLTQSGFTFNYPTLSEALSAIVNKSARKQYHLF